MLWLMLDARAGVIYLLMIWRVPKSLLGQRHTPTKVSDVGPVEGLRLAVVPLRLTQMPVQGELHQSIRGITSDTTASAYGPLAHLMGCSVASNDC